MKIPFAAVAAMTAGVAFGVSVTAGEGWVPMHDSLEIAKGSALDFTSFAGERVPAGTYGRVVAKGDRFEFEQKPGVAQRFYGPNLCYTALYLPDAESTALADLFQRMGYNTVRFHHHENALCTGDDGLTIVPERMAELDALAAKMIARGLYLSTDLFVSREITWRTLGEDRDGKLSILDFSHAVAFKPRYEENLKAFVRKWFTHVNPQTGRRWADEPALAFVSLVNENNPTPDDKFRKLVGAPGKDVLSDADFPEWITDRIAAFDARMIRFLREEIGYRGLVTGLNNSYPHVKAYNRARKAYDYVDGHVYAYHPQFLGREWRLPSAITQYDPLTLRNGCSRWDREYCIGRDFARPYAVSEFNFAVPAEYRCFGGLIYGAGCAANGYAAIWRFAWSHSRESALKPAPLNYFDLARDPIGRANERALLALFLRGDQPADRSVTIAEGPVFAVNTPRTRGELVSGRPSALFSVSLDGEPIETSRRILVTHLTDVRDTEMVFRDKGFTTIEKWGKLPHLMRAERREVALPLKCSGQPVRRRVFALNADGSRRFEVPHVTENGMLRFTADVAADPKDATYLYEVIAAPLRFTGADGKFAFRFTGKIQAKGGVPQGWTLPAGGGAVVSVRPDP